MQLDIIFNKKKSYNKKLYNLFLHNYSNNKEFPPLYQYKCTLDLDYWITMYDIHSNLIIASCSLDYSSNTEYEIGDVLVEEQFRGNNYSVLLIMNVIAFIEQQHEKSTIKIKCLRHNSDAFYCYKKIFDIDYSDNSYVYFSIKIS